MEKTFQKEEAERQRLEGGNCLGLSKEMQKPKMWDVAFGGKVNRGRRLVGQIQRVLPPELRGEALSGQRGVMQAFPAGDSLVRWGLRIPPGNLHSFSHHPCSLLSFFSFTVRRRPTKHAFMPSIWCWEDSERSKTGSPISVGIL